MAGLGAEVDTSKVGRGKSVAVIGCGGVSVAAIAKAVTGTEFDPRRRRRHPGKLEAASRMGATHTVNSKDVDPVVAICRRFPAGRPARRRRHRRGGSPRDLEAGVASPASLASTSCWSVGLRRT